VTRARRFLATPFGVAVLGLLVLAGWALLSAGVLDGPLARQIRSSSIYTAPGVALDHAAAERIVGNRRLVVAFLEPGADLGDHCDDTDGAADNTIVLLLSRGDGEFESYGCSHFPGGDDENFGKAVVAETQIGSGVDQFADDPLSALKVVAVNYDGLVKAGMIPDGARTINPSLPRYLVAGAALLAVVGGTAGAYVAGRRAGAIAAGHREERDTAADERSTLSARAAVLAQHIIELDRRYAQSRKRHVSFRKRYRALASDYADLVVDFTAADRRGEVDATLRPRVESLTERCRDLARSR
jgi:hypothetical protein